MDRLDRAIGINTMVRAMARSSRAMTVTGRVNSSVGRYKPAMTELRRARFRGFEYQAANRAKLATRTS
jgi:hypothetical protein